MKRLLMIATCASMAACTGHLPSTQYSELDDVRAAIQKARDAGAEQCAPAELAKAEARQLHAAHELDEGSSYDQDAASFLIDDGKASADQAYAKCTAAKPKPAPKPKPVVIQPKPAPKPMVVKPEVIALDGVFFESNSANLTASSTATLDKAVEALKKRADVKVEVAAHTDSGGKASYNEHLSGLRAQAVRGYLVSHGIDATRLTAKGYGEASPIADNATKEGRAKNRRVELIIK